MPAYTALPKVLKINYPTLQAGLGTVLVNCESEAEIMADKVVALCLRKIIKARDLWDMVMLEQHGLSVNDKWVRSKFKDYGCEDEPLFHLKRRQSELLSYWASGQFEVEMKRFLPQNKVAETFELSGFMSYFVDTITTFVNKTVKRWDDDGASDEEKVFRL